jgi:fatty-acyl-CoA synthase
VAAWIQLQPGQNMTVDELREFFKKKIAHFKIPKQIRFTDEFPMTVTGKVQKFRMRELTMEAS